MRRNRPNNCTANMKIYIRNDSTYKRLSIPNCALRLREGTYCETYILHKTGCASTISRFCTDFYPFYIEGKKKKKKKKSVYTPCYFSPLSEIPGSIELLENSLTYEGVQWRKIVECIIHAIHFKVEDSDLDY